MNLPASFSLRGVNLPYGGVYLSTTFSLGGTNPSHGEFILPFGESLLSLENRLCCYVSCCIPFTKFLLVKGSVQTADHSFFNISTRT